VKITVRKDNKIAILEISGRVTLGKGEVVLRGRFKKLLEAGERFFIFHMIHVSYLDSAGIGEMVACAKRAYELGGIIKIVLQPRGKARELFSITCLNRVFEIFEDEEAALAGLRF